MKDNTNTDETKIDWDELVYREFPKGENEFLRCQVGIVEYEMRDVTRQRADGSYPQRRQFSNEPVFRLIGFGETMDDANAMAEKRILRKAA